MKYVIRVVEILSITLFNIYVLNYSILFSMLISILVFIGMYSFRVYDFLEMKNINNQIIRVAVGTIVGFLFIAIFEFVMLFFFFPTYKRNITKLLLLYNFIFNIILIPLIHKLFYIYRLKILEEKNYVVIGDDKELKKVLKEIEEQAFSKIKFKSFFSINKEFSDDELLEISKNYDGILISSIDDSEDLDDRLEKNYRNSIDIKYLPNLVEMFLNRIPIEVIKKNSCYYRVIFQSLSETPEKRLLDIIISLSGLIILFPVILILSLVIAIEDKFPIIFTQKRVGKDGKPFTIHKFRSLKNKKIKKALYISDEVNREILIGKIMRPIRLDEILQFIDIIRGKMSFVGPRPEQLEFVDKYNENIPFYFFRHKYKPGLTGWAQIMYQYASNLEETKVKLSYDLYYLKNRDIIFDLQIILKTLEAIFWRRGAK